ncbi:MAG TPA: GNAT family N-acetyltransferase [Candidatus Baltobacteraceae bacterium]|jgi:ribosomal-protein-alanine N-acetyltransferase|nr:GNAT family N-acetyltransferase [Candidatus Baltobacteraceae bacterium]
MKSLSTERLRLEPVTPANADVLWSVLRAPHLREFQDLPDLSLAQFAAAVSERPRALTPGAAGRFEWLVYRAGSEEAIGWISLRIAERTRSTAEIGYSIVRDHRGRGLASEAVAALVEEGFTNVGLQRIRAYCVPSNLSSRGVLRNNRFEDDGVLPHGATLAGSPVDVIAYTLERARWAAEVTSNRSATGS